MGKSNKFDYSNRSSHGPKLGAIIGRDVEKEADKAANDVVKNATKARKASISSNASGASVDGAPAVSHPMDIKAPNKALGDEGVFHIADGLVKSLEKATAEASCRLEDLNLSDNGITTASLARLAPAIELAKYDLKTLNLSNNVIAVGSDEEAAQWETFLRSFKRCMKLRRLDLSGNKGLGPRALEIFARIHVQEPAVTPISAGGRCSVHSLMADIEEMDTPTTAGCTDKMTGGTFLYKRCGLRSIPYITLTDIGLNDAGALWLSYVLEEHYYPSQLIDEVNAVQPDSTIKTYQQDSNFCGLDWDQLEPSLGKDGLYLLKKTESIRRQTLMDDESLRSNAGYDTDEDEQDFASRSPMKKSVDHRIPRAHPGDRRGSVRSIQTVDGGEHELSELESMRKRLQRHIMKHSGVSSVELFQTGLRIALASIVLRCPGPRPAGRYYVGPPMFHFAQRTPQSVTAVNGSKDDGLRLSIDSARASTTILPGLGTYAATLTAHTGLAPGEPELAITEVTNSPQTPKMIFKPHRKGAFSDGSDLQAVSQKLDGLIIRDDSPVRFIRWQEHHGANEDGPQGFRNSAIRSHFPQHVIERIEGMAVTERQMGLLSAKQRQKAFEWGQDRKHFQAMKDWEKHDDSVYVWTLLENIGCLEYQKEGD